MKGASAADIKCLEKKVMLSGTERDEWWRDGTHEVAFAFHIRTHKVKWYKGNKAKGDTWKALFYHDTEWITGTADYAKVSQAGGEWHFSIDDLKTGRWPVDATENKQLLTYVMPFWLEAGKPLNATVCVSITQWPRYPLSGLPQKNLWWTDGLTLAEHLQDLAYALDNPNETEPSLDNCRFCDAKNNCSAFLASGITFGRTNG